MIQENSEFKNLFFFYVYVLNIDTLLNLEVSDLKLSGVSILVFRMVEKVSFYVVYIDYIHIKTIK